jgi:hypothetical protein
MNGNNHPLTLAWSGFEKSQTMNRSTTTQFNVMCPLKRPLLQLVLGEAKAVLALLPLSFGPSIQSHGKRLHGVKRPNGRQKRDLYVSTPSMKWPWMMKHL